MYIVIIKLQNCPFCALLAAIVISLTFFTHITILYYSHVFMSCPFACLFHYTYNFFFLLLYSNKYTHSRSVFFSGGHRNFINATCGFSLSLSLPMHIYVAKISLEGSSTYREDFCKHSTVCN